MTVVIGPYVVGEIPAPLVYTFQDSAGTSLDLTGGYVARFSWRDQERATAGTSGNATVTDAAAGDVTYVWTGSELLTTGTFVAEFWIGNGVNRFASQLLLYTVRAPVAGVPAI